MRPIKFVAAAALVALAACVDNHGSLEFAKLCAPPEPSDEGGCVYPAECELFLARGRPTVDVAFTGGQLDLPIEMHNNLFPNEDPSSNRVNSTDLRIIEWRFAYEGAFTGPDVIVAVAHQVEAGGQIAPLVPLITPAVGDMLRTSPLLADGVFHELMVNVYAVAQLNDGSRFTTGPFRVPVDVCAGCFGVVPACPKPLEQIPVACPRFGQTASAKCIDIQ